MTDDELEGDYRWTDEEYISKRLGYIGHKALTINSQDQMNISAQTLQMDTNDQALQIERQSPHIIIEDQIGYQKEDMSDIEKINRYDQKFLRDKNSSIMFKEQKLDNKPVGRLKLTNKTNKTNNMQKSEKLEKEELAITKSDIQDIKSLLEDILYVMKESDGFKKYPYDEKGEEAIEEGLAQIYKYRNYYDVVNTIKTAGPIDPNDFDSPVYNKERIFEDLERYADIINVINDGTDTLFVIVSHGGRTNFSKEAIVFPGEVKTYYQVYELRLRSPTEGLPYRITEYSLMDVSETSFIPIEKVTLHDAELPDEDTNWLITDIIPTRSPSTLRIEVAISISGIFKAAITNEGNTQIVDFNATSGPELVENSVYVFELLVNKGDSINFQFSTSGGKIKILRVQEIDAVTA